jgi:hypothetical protein
VLACVLRILLRPAHLWSDDCYNVADALERFDPKLWHPQPPGYPLFVLQSKLIHFFVPSVEDTFLVGVILGTAVALLMTLLLGREMFRSWMGGVLAAALLLVNPTFIFTGLTSTIRVYEAAIPLLVAYYCWRLWRGDSSCWWMAALALGIGSGYRPQLLALMFPLWAWSAWRGKRDTRQFLAGLALVALSSGVWIAFLFSRFGDWKSFSTIFGIYVTNQFRNTSPLFDAPVKGWLRMLGMLIAWNGLAVAGWMLFRFFAKPRAPRGTAWFLALWMAPSLMFHATVHIGAADQALVTIAALCLLGGGVFACSWSGIDTPEPRRRVAVALNLVAFWKPILLPFADPNGIKGQARHAQAHRRRPWETSWRSRRERRERAGPRELRRRLPDGPAIRHSLNRSAVSWRKLALLPE